MPGARIRGADRAGEEDRQSRRHEAPAFAEASAGKHAGLPQHGGGFFCGSGEDIDLLKRIVGGEGGADGAGGAEAGHQRLAAMVAGADGDTHLVDQGAEVVVVDAVEVEGEGADAVFGAVEADAVDRGERLGGCADELGLVLGEDVEADGVYVVERGGECDGALDVGSAGFVFEGGSL